MVLDDSNACRVSNCDATCLVLEGQTVATSYGQDGEEENAARPPAKGPVKSGVPDCRLDGPRSPKGLYCTCTHTRDATVQGAALQCQAHASRVRLPVSHALRGRLELCAPPCRGYRRGRHQFGPRRGRIRVPLRFFHGARRTQPPSRHRFPKPLGYPTIPQRDLRRDRKGYGMALAREGDDNRTACLHNARRQWRASCYPPSHRGRQHERRRGNPGNCSLTRQDR